MKIKGLILLARKDFVLDQFGKKAWDKVLDALPPQDQEILTGMILTATWYPFEMGERLDNAVVKILGKGKKAIFEEIGAKSAKRSLNTIHKAFLEPRDPHVFMSKSNVIYNFYYDTGYREYEKTGPCSGVMTTYEAETFSVPDCLTVIGWYKEALKMCGAKNIKVVEKECRAKGGSCCRYEFKWEK